MFLFILLKSTEEQKRYRQNLFEYYSIFMFIFTTVVQNIDNIDLKFNLGLASHKLISKPDHKTYGKNPTMEETLLLKRSPPPWEKVQCSKFSEEGVRVRLLLGGGDCFATVVRSYISTGNFQSYTKTYLAWA